MNLSCAFDAYLESILLADPLEIFFRQHRPEGDIVSVGSPDVYPASKKAFDRASAGLGVFVLPSASGRNDMAHGYDRPRAHHRIVLLTKSGPSNAVIAARLTMIVRRRFMVSLPYMAKSNRAAQFKIGLRMAPG